MPLKDPAELRKYLKAYRLKNREKLNAYSRENQRKMRGGRNRPKWNAYAKQWTKDNPDKVRAAQRKYSRNLRLQALEKLGSKCERCGFNDPRALQIDHINGGGVRERKKGTSQHVFYRSIVNGERTDLQLLCANCNWIKRAERKEYSPELS